MNTSEAALTTQLHQLFGFDKFRPGQLAVIQAVLRGKDTLAVLPTGTGKSLCYQFAGRALGRPVIIVSPLLSLMQDQVEQLRAAGEKRVVALTSTLTRRERTLALQTLAANRFIYLAPEMAVQPAIISRLKELRPALFVVDEAHCISQWGPDFRPDYRRLGRVRHALGDPVTLALTATASPRVQRDIVKALRLNQPSIQVHSVDRPNIFLAVEAVENERLKDERLVDLVRTFQGPGLVYFASKQRANEVARMLEQQAGVRAAAYHADRTSADRAVIQQQFLHHQLDVVCATSAFGMGVNKADIRYVIHYHLPADLESYVQEIGRAGRDGKQSLAVLLYQPGDETIQHRLGTANLLPAAEVQFLAAHRHEKRFFQDERTALVQTLVDAGMKPATITRYFDRRRQEKQRALQAMMDYVQTTACRHQFITDYFGEQTRITHTERCCAAVNTSLTPEQLGMARRHAPAGSGTQPGYVAILQQLFNL